MSSKSTFAQELGAALQGVRRINSLLWLWEARLKGVILDGNVIFVGRPLLSVAPGSELRLGDGVQINSAQRANPLACFQPSVLRTMAPGAKLVLERGVGISGAVVCAAAAIEIGEGTIVGSGAMLLDNDFHVPGAGWEWAEAPVSNAKPVRIGRGVFVGARAIVLKGVTLGDRCVVGAGAVVTKDVPAGMLATGNPARILPARTAETKPSEGDSAQFEDPK